MSSLNGYTHVVHSFEPVYDEQSRVLILGSLPSVKSREQGFYYGHPQNRFWKVISAAIGCDTPQTVEEKRLMLLRHRIAVWDVIAECDIIGSSDASIKNARPTELSRIFAAADIKAVFANGSTAGRLYKKHQQPKTGREAAVLPSTSPANAAWGLERLTDYWREQLCEYLD